MLPVFLPILASWSAFDVVHTECNYRPSVILEFHNTVNGNAVEYHSNGMVMANISAYIYNTGSDTLTCNIVRGFLGPDGRPEGSCVASSLVNVLPQNAQIVSTNCVSGEAEMEHYSYYQSQFLIGCTSVGWPSGEYVWTEAYCRGEPDSPTAEFASLTGNWGIERE